MRYLFGLICVLALGVGCETTGADGDGGAGGNGGNGGTGAIQPCEVAHDCDDENPCTDDAWGDDRCQNVAVEDGTTCNDGNECTVSACAGGVCDPMPVQDGTACTEHPYADAEGTCTQGRCTVSCNTAEDCMDVNECAVGACSNGTCDSTPVQNGTLCGQFPGNGPERNCFEGQCALPCDAAEDCSDDNDCTEDTCLQVDGGSMCGDHTALADGTTCAGGTCQVGKCQVTNFDMPCTEQGFRNAVLAGCGPYTFDCDAPTELGEPHFQRDIILDGGGNLTIAGGPLVSDGASAEMRRFVILTKRVLNSGGTLQVVNSTATSADEPVFFDDMRIEDGSSLTLVDCTLLAAEEMEIISDNGEVLIANSTFSLGTEGGGVGQINTHDSPEGGVTVINSTLRSRGPFWVIGVSDNAAPVMIAATIVDGGCAGDIVSNGYNIESPGNTCGFDQEGDQSDVTAVLLDLQPLADNGGPTQTHAITTNSAAFNAGTCEVDEDQRGVTRPQGPACDVGAFELEVGP